ncbi:uncharacterized protein LOC123301281 [Chrysoperla carnea]|uniref:uncharacterized protein LOC123301281 n=1 Tax=Chrysoperla carnea TaxID=189513 RepID=UPI001D06E726|nr:uncharacterized protein LOC123301281 [Chrysoperla carnea]
MTSPTAEIEKYVIVKLHNAGIWPIEIVNDDDDKPKSDRKTVINPDDIIPSDQDFASKRKNSFYILIFDTWIRFKEQMSDVFESKSYNPSANFLIYVHNVHTQFTAFAQQVLEYLWQNQCLNAVVLLPSLHNDTVNAYTLDVYNPAKICGTNLTCRRTATCSNGIIKNTTTYLFNNKVPADSHGCTIPAVAMTWPPFVINASAETDPGMEIYVLKAIGQYFNFTVNFTQSANPWGRRKNGTWTGLFSKIQKNEAMIALGNIFSNQQIYEDFYISTPYYSSCVVWYVPIAELVPRWRSIAAIFKLSVWISLICTLFASAISWYCLAKYSKTDIGLRDIGICLLNGLCIVFGISTPTRPLSALIRAIFLMVSVYGIHINAFYQASLIRILTDPPREHQISNLHELVTSSLKFGGTPNFRSFYNESNETISKYIFDNYEIIENYTTPHPYLQKVTTTKKYATLANKFFFDFYVARGDKSVCDSTHCPAIYSFKQNVLCYTINMVATKGFPYMEGINNLILLFRENGVLEKWMKDIQSALRRTSGQRSSATVAAAVAANITTSKIDTDMDDSSTTLIESNDKTIILTLDHLQSAFAFFTLGIFFSCIVFVIEFLTNCEGVIKYIYYLRAMKVKVYSQLKTMCRYKREVKKVVIKKK